MSNLTYAQYLVQISNYINNYSVIAHSAIGIPANLLSILIFARLMKNKTNMGYLYVWQSVVDLIMLLSYLLLFQSTQIYGISLITYNNFWCKLIKFLRRFIIDASSWVAVFTTFDRFIFVLHGNTDRFKFMKKKRYLTLCIVSILFVIMLLDIPNLYFYLNVSCTADYAIIISTDIISILVRTYIPFILMIGFNIVLIKKTFNRAKVNTIRNSTKSTRKEHQFTIAVIAYDMFFIIFNFPRSIYFVFYDVNLYSGAMDGNPVFSASYSIVNAATSNLAIFVQTFSFLTYLRFNKLYRKELLGMLGKILPISSLRSINQTSTNQTVNHTNNSIALNTLYTLKNK